MCFAWRPIQNISLAINKNNSDKNISMDKNLFEACNFYLNSWGNSTDHHHWTAVKQYWTTE
jgi:hypothetical protein